MSSDGIKLEEVGTLYLPGDSSPTEPPVTVEVEREDGATITAAAWFLDRESYSKAGRGLGGNMMTIAPFTIVAKRSLEQLPEGSGVLIHRTEKETGQVMSELFTVEEVLEKVPDV